MIHDVLESMKRECRESGRLDLWTVFEGRILARIMDNQESVSYESLAKDLKLSSPIQAANLLVTAKRMYARLLREAIAEYEREPADVDQEIADLREILARSPIPHEG